MFSDPGYERLELKHSRLVVPWNWQREVHVRDQVGGSIAAAKTARVRPLIAFGRDYSKGGEKRLPSLRAYRKMFRAFRAEYPHVREFSPWNEANHAGQPTYRKPRAAARFYNFVRASCRRCTIVAADVLTRATWCRGSSSSSAGRSSRDLGPAQLQGRQRRRLMAHARCSRPSRARSG